MSSGLSVLITKLIVDTPIVGCALQPLELYRRRSIVGGVSNKTVKTNNVIICDDLGLRCDLL